MQIMVISKYADMEEMEDGKMEEGDGRQHGEDETQDFNTKAFLINIFMSL